MLTPSVERSNHAIRVTGAAGFMGLNLLWNCYGPLSLYL